MECERRAVKEGAGVWGLRHQHGAGVGGRPASHTLVWALGQRFGLKWGGAFESPQHVQGGL